MWTKQAEQSTLLFNFQTQKSSKVKELEVQKFNSRLMRVCWTRWAQSFFAIGNFFALTIFLLIFLGKLPSSYNAKLNDLCELFNSQEVCKKFTQENLRNLITCSPLNVNFNKDRLTFHLQLTIPVIIPSKKIFQLYSIPLYHSNTSFLIDVEGRVEFKL